MTVVNKINQNSNNCTLFSDKSENECECFFFQFNDFNSVSEEDFISLNDNI